MIRTLLSLLLLTAAAPATTLELLDGAAQSVPAGTTGGWGWRIQNSSAYWLLPVAVATSGLSTGLLVELFAYPVIAPGAAVSQSYAYGAPGGYGFSQGLMEFILPANAPAGMVQTGSFRIDYQLFAANPDTDPNAALVGGVQSLPLVDFSLTVLAASGGPVGVPEPASWIAVGIGLLLAVRGRR